MSDDVDVPSGTEEPTPLPNAPTPGETAPPSEVIEVKQEQPPKTFTQSELDREIGKRLDRQERKIRAELLGLVREKINPPAPAKEEPKQAEPKLEQFKDWDEFNRALIRHEARQEAAKIVEERENSAKVSREAEEWNKRQTEVSSAHVSRVNGAKTKYEDYDDVVDPILGLNVPSYLVDMVTESDKSGDLLYKLGENPKEFLRIAKLPPVAAARELAKLELSIVEPTRQPSNAPAPVTPIVGSPRESLGDPDAKRQSREDWMRAREAQIKKERKRG